MSPARVTVYCLSFLLPFLSTPPHAPHAIPPRRGCTSIEAGQSDGEHQDRHRIAQREATRKHRDPSNKVKKRSGSN
eukprot:1292140-Rhodomonas_salina.1